MCPVLCAVFVQEAFSESRSVALRLSTVEEELNRLTSDLSALLQQVSMVFSIQGSLHPS